MKRLPVACLFVGLTLSRAVSAQPVPSSAAPPPVPLHAPPATLAVPAPLAPSAPPATPAKPDVTAHESKPGDVVSLRFKPGSGVILATADKRFSLAIRSRIQLRYDAELPNEEGEEASHLFQVRRMRLQFVGNAFGEHNKFYVQLGLSPRDMTGGLVADSPNIRYNPVRDARIELDYLRDLTVWLGQMKVPFSRQRVISSGNLEMVDRALANEEFQLDRDIGVHVLSKDLFGLNRLAYSLGLFLGEGRNAFELADSGMLWVARLEWLPFGKFDDYSEGDLARTANAGLAVGAAYAFHDNAPGDRSVHGNAPADGGTTDYHNATADVMFKHKGVSAQLAFHYREGTRTPGDAVDDEGGAIPVAKPRNGVGMLAQWGYVLPWVDLQVTARYAMARNVDRQASSLNGRNEASVGLGYYFGGHQYKVQVDYSRLWNEDAAGDSGAAFSKGTDRLRAQIQLSL